ncbi:SDR family NAD(P)-dependent oxidoreductase [Streptomyces tritici]|uniref:SDR family NAD(P)-dependent oxidoreductase n=1 Tax=Streptomyces tritici TaxID=2054410 RepID=UPI003AF02C3D
MTGASSGIGRAAAVAFARQGARLVVTARSTEALEEVARQCADEHPEAQALAVPGDVTDPDAMVRVAEAALTHYGGMDVWVNAAGVGLIGRLDRLPVDDVRRLWDVNVLGVLNGTRAALPALRRRPRGVLINVSSVLGGAVPAPYMGAYAVSKAALVMLDDVLREELALSGTGTGSVTVCTVLPAGVDTPFFSHAANHTRRRVRRLPAVATPERVARRIVRAAARPRRRVVVGPGARLLPRLYAAAPGLVRGVISRRIEHGYLDAAGTAPLSTGVLHEPSGATAGIRGGRHAGARTAARRAVAAACAAAASTAALKAVAARRPRPG